MTQRAKIMKALRVAPHTTRELREAGLVGPSDAQLYWLASIGAIRRERRGYGRSLWVFQRDLRKRPGPRPRPLSAQHRLALRMLPCSTTDLAAKIDLPTVRRRSLRAYQIMLVLEHRGLVRRAGVDRSKVQTGVQLWRRK